MGKCAEAADGVPLLILISQHPMQETSEKTETRDWLLKVLPEPLHR